MIEIMIEVIFIAGILLFAVCIAFCIVQGAVMAGFLSAALSFSPMEILSLIAGVWWISYVTAVNKMFDKLIGE